MKPAKPKPPPPLPLIRGQKDKHNDGCSLVPVGKAPNHPVFPKLYKPMIPPGTFFRFDKTQKKVTTLVTIMPDGLYVAWWTCRTCSAVLTNCQCQRGMTVSRSIEYIFDSTVARQKGEEWSIHHPNYGGSFTKAQSRTKAPTWDLPASSVARTTPKAKKAVSGASTKPKRHLPGHGEPAPAKFDLRETDQAASKRADELTKGLTRRLVKDEKPKRSLKRSEPKPAPKKRRSLKK